MDKQIKIYTKTGDDGTTGLVGGNRVKKYDLRLEAYGTVDELNSYIGLIRSFITDKGTANLLEIIQHSLFNVGSRLASDEKGDAFTSALAISDEKITMLENAIDKFEHDLPEIKGFILPAGDQVVGYCHVARTVCRRAERRIVEFADMQKVDEAIIKFINRLSDFLFVLARKFAADRGVEETFWKQM